MASWPTERLTALVTSAAMFSRQPFVKRSPEPKENVDPTCTGHFHVVQSAQAWFSSSLCYLNTQRFDYELLRMTSCEILLPEGVHTNLAGQE